MSKTNNGYFDSNELLFLLSIHSMLKKEYANEVLVKNYCLQCMNQKTTLPDK